MNSSREIPQLNLEPNPEFDSLWLVDCMESLRLRLSPKELREFVRNVVAKIIYAKNNNIPIVTIRDARARENSLILKDILEAIGDSGFHQLGKNKDNVCDPTNKTNAPRQVEAIISIYELKKPLICGSNLTVCELKTAGALKEKGLSPRVSLSCSVDVSKEKPVRGQIIQLYEETFPDAENYLLVA